MPSHVKLEVPFTYNVVGRYRNKRKHNAVRVRDQALFAMLQADPRDAPVALRARHPQFRASNEIVDVRWAAGKLWVPIQHQIASGQPYHPLMLDEMATIVAEHRWSSGFSLPNDVRTYRFDQALEPGSHGYADVHQDGREDKIADIQAALDDFLVVDGLVHRSVPEPLYRLTENRDWNPEVRVAWWHERAATAGTTRYGLDELEELRNELGRIAPDRDPNAAFVGGPVEVLMPEVLAADPVADDLAAEMQALLESVDNRGLSRLPVEALIAFAAVRDAMEAQDLAAAAAAAPALLAFPCADGRRETAERAVGRHLRRQGTAPIADACPDLPTFAPVF